MNYNPNDQIPNYNGTEQQNSAGLSRPVPGKQKDTGRKSKKDKKKSKGKFPLWKNVLAMIVLVALYIGGSYWAADKYTRHGQEVTAPQLNGLTIEQAMNRLDALGLIGEIRDSAYIRNMTPDVVCKQSVEAGNKVKQGRIIYLTINSDKAERLVLPDVADNGSFREATAKLRALGFTVTSPEYIDGEKDWVYSVKCNGRTITAGTRVDINDPVTLVVGNGSHTMEEDIFPAPFNWDSIGVYNEMIDDRVIEEEPMEFF